MARIGIILPYQDFYHEVKAVIEESNDIEVKSGVITNGVEIAKELVNSGAEILIVRGGTANYIRKEFNCIPVLDIEISSYDITDAILTAKKLKKDIALVIFRNMLYEQRNLSNIFGCNIGTYYIEREEEAQNAIIQALKDGYQIIVGGTIAHRISTQLGISCIFIRSSIDSLRRTIEEARNILKTKDESVKELNLIRDVIENTSIGIVAVNKANVVSISNKTALILLNKKRDQILGKAISNLFPSSVTEVVGDAVIDIDGNSLIIDRKPLNIESIDIASIFTIEELSGVNQKQLSARNLYVKKGYTSKYSFEDIKGRSKEIKELINTAKKYALANSTILIEGETGTGKEMLSQSIHGYSLRKGGPFVAVNCAALTESILESELFGYVKGAFTGASNSGKPGLFEMANTGTILLDEISEVSLTTQAKLLRVIQEKEVMRLGDDRIIPIDVRVIATTNRDLRQLAKEGKFRTDLYYRISVLKLKIPSLEDRKGDIKILFNDFLDYFTNFMRVRKPIIHQECYELIESYKWEGNIRELRNFVERLVTVRDEKIILPEMLYGILDVGFEFPYKQLDINDVLEVLGRNNYNKSKTAKELGISRTTLWRILKEMK